MQTLLEWHAVESKHQSIPIFAHYHRHSCHKKWIKSSRSLIIDIGKISPHPTINYTSKLQHISTYHRYDHPQINKKFPSRSEIEETKLRAQNSPKIQQCKPNQHDSTHHYDSWHINNKFLCRSQTRVTESNKPNRRKKLLENKSIQFQSTSNREEIKKPYCRE